MAVGKMTLRKGKLPLLQVVRHPDSQGVVAASLVFGFLSFGMIFSMVRPHDFQAEWVGLLVGKLFFTLVATLVVTGFMTLLHVPSGH